MSPMGYAVNRQARHIASVMDENSLYGDDYDAKDMAYIKPVPIWLCVFLVIGYIIGGAYMFHELEEWNYLDSAYFCFITLTTIGELRRESFSKLSIAMLPSLGGEARMF
jgi:Ion channel